MTNGSAAYGTILQMNGIAIAEVKNFGGPGMGQDVPETTHQESTGAASEFVGALLDGGEVTLDVNFLPQNATQALNTDGSLIYAMYQRSAEDFELVWPDSSSTTWVFRALVVEFKADGDSPDRLAGTITLKITGKTTQSGAFFATSGGLYKTSRIEFDRASDPRWTLQGDALYITHFSAADDDPEQLQLAVAGSDDSAIYLRRPASDDSWQEILNYTDALSVIGVSSQGFDNFIDVACDSHSDRIVVLFSYQTTGHYLLISDDYGDSWTSVSLNTEYGAFRSDNLVVDQTTGDVYIGGFYNLGGNGAILNYSSGALSEMFSSGGGGWAPILFAGADGTIYGGDETGETYPDLISSDSWEEIDGPAHYGITSNYDGDGAAPTDTICVIREDDIYISDDGGVTWATLILGDPRDGKAIAALSKNQILFAFESAGVLAPHSIYSTDGTSVYEKSGANADQADGGGDSVPYNVTPARNAIVLFDAGY